MDVKMAAGWLARAAGLVVALAIVHFVLLGHLHGGAATPYLTPGQTPVLGTQIHMYTGTIICRHHC